MKPSLEWYPSIWSIKVEVFGFSALSILLPSLEEADAVGCGLQVVNQPTLPKSALAIWRRASSLLASFGDELACIH